MSYHKCLKCLPSIEKIPSFIFIGFKVPKFEKLKYLLLKGRVSATLVYSQINITNASCTR